MRGIAVAGLRGLAVGWRAQSCWVAELLGCRVARLLGNGLLDLDFWFTEQLSNPAPHCETPQPRDRETPYSPQRQHRLIAASARAIPVVELLQLPLPLLVTRHDPFHV